MISQQTPIMANPPHSRSGSMRPVDTACTAMAVKIDMATVGMANSRTSRRRRAFSVFMTSSIR